MQPPGPPAPVSSLLAHCVLRALRAQMRDRALGSLSEGVTISDPNLPDCPIIYCNDAFLVGAGRWALGAGAGLLGAGRWALGAGHWALGAAGLLGFPPQLSSQGQPGRQAVVCRDQAANVPF